MRRMVQVSNRRLGCLLQLSKEVRRRNHQVIKGTMKRRLVEVRHRPVNILTDEAVLVMCQCFVK